MFEPGQKVVCVDGKFTPSVLRLLQQVPVKDKVYVVRDVKIGFLPVKGGKRDGAVRVLLIGLVNPDADDGQEHGFNAERFRSLDEVKEKNKGRKVIKDANGQDALSFIPGHGYSVGKVSHEGSLRISSTKPGILITA